MVIVSSRPYSKGLTREDRVSTNAYSGKGKLIRSSSYAVTNGATSTLSQTLYTYDEFGDNELVISDRDFDGAIDWCGPDVIASNATAYVNDGGAWWRENARYAIDRDGSVELRFAGATRTRLTGLGNGLAAETVSIDIRGNATTNRTYRNRASAEEITWRKLPTSSTTMLTIATDGLVRLTVSEVPRPFASNVAFADDGQRGMEFIRASGRLSGGWAGGWVGAEGGAAIGAMVGPIGAAVGACVGVLIGSFGGSIAVESMINAILE